MAARLPDDVVHLFAAIGLHDAIAKAIDARFGGLVDAVSVSDLPPDLIQDLQRIPTRYHAA